MSSKVKSDILMLAKISNIIMELSKVDSLNTSYKALSDIVKDMVEIEEEYFFIKNSENYEEIFERNFSDELSELVRWSYSKTDISIFPEDEGSYIIIPIAQATNVNFVYAIFTKEQNFSNRFMMILRTTSFLMGNLFETLKLYEEILDKNILIEKNKNFLDNILNSTFDSVAVYNENLIIQFMNNNFRNVTNNEKFRKIIDGYVISSIAEKQNKSFEYEYEDKSYSFDLINIIFEKEYYVLVNIRDISGTKELEKMKKIEKMKNEFLSTMSHELRTPLSSIKAYSETLISSLEMIDKEMLEEFLTTIHNESEHLEALLNNLLDYSKLETHTLTIDRTKTDMIELMNSVIKALNDSIESKSIEVSVELEEDSIILDIDKTRIKQVLLNLIQNAVKYHDESKDKKVIKILIRTTLKECIIKIEDNGLGIAEEHLDKIFEKFYRADSSLTYNVQGTGIGLAIVKELVDLHGGSINVESVLGEGSTFTLTLPKEMV
jgi:two-component system OmpR family sensor kinase